MNIKKEIEEFIFQVKESNFMGEHNLVHTPTLEALKEEVEQLFKKYAHQHCDELIGKDEKEDGRYLDGAPTRNNLRQQLRKKNDKLKGSQ